MRIGPPVHGWGTRQPRRRATAGGSRRAWRAVVALVVLGQAAVAGAAFGQEPASLQLPDSILPEWDISGSNTLRTERYIVNGDTTASPYAFEGPQSYDDLSLSFSKRTSAFERWQGQVSGVVNRSDYRAADRNFIAERANLTWEKGDSALPYRLELGDYFAFFSLRSLQRSLKGAQVEIQPTGGFAGETHSGVFLSGFAESDYRDIDPSRDFYSGGSWLIEHPGLGRLSLNGVYNFREEDIAAGSPERKQTVLSLAGETKLPLAGRTVGVELETAFFHGDYGTGSSTSRSRSEAAYIAQIADDGSGTPLSYSLRFERMGRDFQPNGGAVTPNRQSWELRGGWLFPNKLRLNGRLQRFTDGLEETTSTVRELAGFDLSGPAPFAGASLNFSGFVQDQESRDRTTHNLTRSLSADLGFPLPAGWTAGGNLNLVRTDDFSTDTGTITRQFTLRASHQVGILGLEGSLSPGLAIRSVTSANARFELVPSLALNLAGGPHSVSMDYRFSGQRTEGSPDIDSHNASLNYGYRTGPHNFGVEFSLGDRAPETGDGTRSYKAAVYWRLDFAKPARVEPAPAGAALPAAAPATSPATFRLTGLAPGLPLALARKRLDDAGISGGVVQGGAVVYEVRLLTAIDRRQRLALAHDRGRLTRAALIIDLDAGETGANAVRTFDRVREVLIRRYGNPAGTFSQGEPTAAFVADVNAGRFIRNAEWRTIAGTIRLGIPRRLDRRARIEVQIAPSFAPPRQTLWSIESVP